MTRDEKREWLQAVITGLTQWGFVDQDDWFWKHQREVYKKVAQQTKRDENLKPYRSFQDCMAAGLIPRNRLIVTKRLIHPRLFNRIEYIDISLDHDSSHLPRIITKLAKHRDRIRIEGLKSFKVSSATIEQWQNKFGGLLNYIMEGLTA